MMRFNNFRFLFALWIRNLTSNISKEVIKHFNSEPTLVLLWRVFGIQAFSLADRVNIDIKKHSLKYHKCVS